MAALLSLLLFVSLPRQGLWSQVALKASHGVIFEIAAVLVLSMHPPAGRADGYADRG